MNFLLRLATMALVAYILLATGLLSLILQMIFAVGAFILVFFEESPLIAGIGILFVLAMVRNKRG